MRRCYVYKDALEDLWHVGQWGDPMRHEMRFVTWHDAMVYATTGYFA